MPELLRLDHISKSFDGTQMLSGACLTLQTGEVHALIGPNGTGKTVLLRIISGMLAPDDGQILLDGQPLLLNGPNDALKSGIVPIYESIYLIPELTIAENVVFGREPHRKFCGISYIDWKDARRKTKECLEKFHLDISPDLVVGRLTVGQQRMVEIIRALTSNARLVIVDEPALFLSEGERQTFFGLIQDASRAGTTFLLLTNRVGEVFAVTDGLSLLKDGAITTIHPEKGIGLQDAWENLGFEPAATHYPKLNVKFGAEVLSVRKLSRPGSFDDINFTLREGEILGIAGLPGSGARAVGKAIFGLSPGWHGEMRLYGRPFVPTSTVQARRAHIGYVSGSHPIDTLLMQKSISFNMTLPNLRRLVNRSVLNSSIEREMSSELSTRLHIRNFRTERVEYLSGGNQRKVSFGRWIMGNVRLLILEEPTIGMDAASRLDICNIISQLVLGGTAVLLISSDFQELTGMCDHVLVMRGGVPVQYFEAAQGMEPEVWLYACGIEQAQGG